MTTQDREKPLCDFPNCKNVKYSMGKAKTDGHIKRRKWCKFHLGKGADQTGLKAKNEYVAIFN